MKIKDIINEAYAGFAGRTKDHGSVKQTIDPAIPNTRIQPRIRNTDTYMQYRYGVALAAAAAQQDDEWEQESPWAENFITLGYTESEVEQNKAAEKLMGVSGITLSQKSQERPDAGTASPVAKNSWRK